MSGLPDVLNLAPQVQRDEVEDILFICSGNVCRSPMAAELLKAQLGELPPARIRSAGFLREARPPTKHVIRVMRRRGLDLTGHVSSPVSTSELVSADLVLAMTRQHLRSLVDLDLRLFPRTFTLKEFVRLAEVEGQRLTDEELSHYVDRVGARRNASIKVPGVAHDISDPMGRGRSAHEGCAREIEHLVSRLAVQLYPDRAASRRKRQL